MNIFIFSMLNRISPDNIEAVYRKGSMLGLKDC